VTVKPMLTGARNGLPERSAHDWTYRGELPLEVELPYECAGRCGRRCSKPERCAVCRGEKYYEPSKCPRCGRKPGSRNCRILGGA
jgi:hypothetical protein